MRRAPPLRSWGVRPVHTGGARRIERSCSAWIPSADWKAIMPLFPSTTGTEVGRDVSDSGRRSPLGNVLVVGGGGFYGRYVVADLLQHTNAKIVVASRRPRPIPSPDGRVVTVTCDINDLASLKRVVAESDVVVHCAGPFQ